MDVREKLVELLRVHPCYNVDCEKCDEFQDGCWLGKLADKLIRNGVTFAEDINVPAKWILVEAGELQNYIGVPVCIERKTDGECWWAIIRGIKGDKVSTDYDGYFKLSEYGEIWMVKYLPMPQPPKGE